MKTTESIVIDGYDMLGEGGRLRFPDRTVCGRSLNRGTATIGVQGQPDSGLESVKQAHAGQILPTTLEAVSPVLDLSHPVAGMFVDSPTGVYMDLYQGVAQKLLDEGHPVFRQVLDTLAEHGLTFRREINTDDFVTAGAIRGLHTPQELAALVNGLTSQAFGGEREYRCFFSNSGAEAGEAAIKLAQLHAYRRLVGRYGLDVLARLMDDLGIDRDAYYDDQTGLPDPIYVDYPFVIFGCDGGFHGRTLGVLNLTRSKKAQHLGFSKLRWARHVAFNGEVSQLTDQLDDRPLPEILDAPRGVAGVLAEGRVPGELVAGFFTEVYQGEGGYRLADRTWLEAVAEACQSRGILFGTDEVQSFGRTGRLYATEHFDVVPDLIWMAKAAVLGITVARADLADDCHVGWHSNTFGSGKVLDVNMAWATMHALTSYRDELFEGRTPLENSRLKGEYVRMKLAELSAAHPDLLADYSGLGGMWGLTVHHREEIIARGWAMGLKLLGCGPPGELSRIRILLLADVLTREIDEMVAALDRVMTAVEEEHDL